MIQDTLASVASRVRACERTISSPSKRHAQVLLLDRQFLWIFSSTKFIILCIKTYFPALKHDERKEDTGAAFQSGVLNTNYFRSYTYTFSRRGHREEKKAKRMKRTGGLLPFHAIIYNVCMYVRGMDLHR